MHEVFFDERSTRQEIARIVCVKLVQFKMTRDSIESSGKLHAMADPILKLQSGHILVSSRELALTHHLNVRLCLSGVEPALAPRSLH
jgi:hypothetical protein